jgi:hypothetical protein
VRFVSGASGRGADFERRKRVRSFPDFGFRISDFAERARRLDCRRLMLLPNLAALTISAEPGIQEIDSTDDEGEKGEEEEPPKVRMAPLSRPTRPHNTPLPRAPAPSCLQMIPNAKKQKPNPLLELKDHQYTPALAVASHFQNPAKVPGGVLVYYEVGTGKTLSALHAARKFLDLEKGGKVYIVTTNTNIDATWERDWNTYKKAMNAVKDGASRPYTNSIYWGTKHEILEKKTLVEPYMLIVEEAHLLRNMEGKGAQNALRACSSAAYVMLEQLSFESVRRGSCGLVPSWERSFST